MFCFLITIMIDYFLLPFFCLFYAIQDSTFLHPMREEDLTLLKDMFGSRLTAVQTSGQYLSLKRNDYEKATVFIYDVRRTIMR